MVAGGVQSVQEGSLYASHPSYYPQFYSTLLPPAPPGSYSSSNYSSSTYSSSGQSSDCSWLRQEGVEGVSVPSPPARARHPRCTCPSPESLRRARRALAARRVRAWRDPRCTCPSPPGSRDASPWSGTSPSPPSASPPPRHPRCTCPDPDASQRLPAPQRARSARDLRCTCSTANTTPPPSTPAREPRCTCPPHAQQQQQQQGRRSSKGRLVHAVLLNYPGSTAISTDHGDFVRLSDSPAKITESPTPSRARGKDKKGRAREKTKGGKSEDEVEGECGGEGAEGQPSSPARRVKDKLCHLGHKVVSGVAALTAPRPHNKENEARVCHCEGAGMRVRAPGVVTRVLPPPAEPQQEDGGQPGADHSTAGDGAFPVEDLPRPIIEDLCSPLGGVPPLTPPEQVFTPVIRENLLHHPLTRQLVSMASDGLLFNPSIIPPTAPHSGTASLTLGLPHRNLRDLQKLSASHGHLDLTEAASLSRTRSLELYVKDLAEREATQAPPALGGSVSHLGAATAPHADTHRFTKKLLPQSLLGMTGTGESGLHFSTPCITSGSNTCFTTTHDTKVSSSVEELADSGSGPDYENVVFHNSGRYVMLSKRLLDKWQLSYEACLPPDQFLAEHEGLATAVEHVTPIVTVTENGRVSCDDRESDDVALALRPSSTSPLVASTYTSSTLTPPPYTPTPLPSPRTPSPSSSSLSPTHSTHTSPPSIITPPSSTGLSRSPTWLLPSSTRPTSSTHTPSSIFTTIPRTSSPLPSPSTTLHQLAAQHVGGLVDSVEGSPRRSRTPEGITREYHTLGRKENVWLLKGHRPKVTTTHLRRHSDVTPTFRGDGDDGDTDQETDRLLGQQRSDDPGFYDEKEKEANKKKGRSKEVLIEGVLFRARYLGSTQLVSEGQPTKTTRMMQAEEAVSRIKALAPDGESQPSTEVDLFISTEKIMVLNTDLKEIMMDHALRTISYIADIGDLVVLMARRRVLPTDDTGNNIQKTPKMICHVFESDEAQFIAQSIGQAFQVAYLEFLKANGIEDHSFVKEMDYQEVLNSQEIFGDELQMFAKKELQKEVVVPKMKSEILGVVVVESGWGSMVPTVVIANLSPTGAAAKCGQLNIGDQIIAINGVSLVGLPLSTCQNYIKNTKYNTAVKLTVVPCPPVVEVKIRRPDTKYQLGFSVQNGVICSLLRGGIAERGGVRVGHRIIDINSQSVVAVPHEKIVNLLATSVGEIRMKTMPTSIFRLLTGQETPQYI